MSSDILSATRHGFVRPIAFLGSDHGPLLLVGGRSAVPLLGPSLWNSWPPLQRLAFVAYFSTATRHLFRNHYADLYQIFY